MKKNRALLIILSLLFSLSLFACGECKHIDENGDGLCDKCSENVEKSEQSSLQLVTDGEVNFQFVLAKNVGNSTKNAVNRLVNSFKEYDLTPKTVTDGDSQDVIEDVEILIGNVVGRGSEYEFDEHTLGKDGYVIKIIGEKIIIDAGSSESLVTAIEIFGEEIIGFDSDRTDFSNITVTNEDELTVFTENYITSLTVNGEDMHGYTLATNTEDKNYLSVAEYFQAAVYNRSGVWLDIVSLDKATSKSVVIKKIPKVTGDNSFKVRASNDNQLVIECAYDNMLERAVTKFLMKEISLAKGEVDLKGDVYKQDISVVYYEDFGARGDGKTDDYKAMYDAHESANAYGQTVKAKDGARYYIENNILSLTDENGVTTVAARPIVIKTNVDWGNATFIIDDTGLKTKSDYDKKYSTQLFQVRSDYETVTITDKEILKNITINQFSTKINLGEGYNYPALIIPQDDSNIIFRRNGYFSALYGEGAKEIILINKDGNIDTETPVIYDYPGLSSLTVYRVDETPLSVKGGKFTTKLPEIDRWSTNIGTNYVSRNLYVTRSNVTVEGLEHYTEGGVTLKEWRNGDKVGVAYNGFIGTGYTTNVTFKDCVMTAKMSYGHSSYAHSAYATNKTVMDNCTLTNFWVKLSSDGDTIEGFKKWNEKTEGDGYVPSQTSVTYKEGAWQKLIDRGANSSERTSPDLFWGSGGSNFCKNMEIINGSSISRYDAHQGLYNGKIVDSAFNMLAIIGTGSEKNPSTMLIENCSIFTSANLITLRPDYGATWPGDIIFKNSHIYMPDTISIVNKSYQNWYWGYETYFPNITLDNTKFYDKDAYKPTETAGESNATPNYEREITFLSGTGFFKSNGSAEKTKMHLDESHLVPQMEIRDRNGNQRYTIQGWYSTQSDGTDTYKPFTFTRGDGYVDELWDMNGNGVLDNLVINGQMFKVEVINEMLNKRHKNWSEKGFNVDEYLAYVGVDSEKPYMANLNKTYPPKEIKIINDSSRHKFRILDTSGNGISNGMYYGVEENMGGFFGSTTFYYGTGNESVIGTAGEDVGPFIFYK